MDEEAPQEIVRRDCHDLLLAGLSVVLPAEGDAIVLEADEAMVRDRDAVGVASQVVEDVFGSAEGRLGIDDPVLGKELSEESLEACGCCEFLERTMELDLALEQKLLERGRELAAEDAAENPDRQEEAGRGGDPSGAVKREAAARYDAVDMRMVLEVLSPGVQHAEQSDIGTQVLRVASDFEQRGGTGTKEQIVEQPLVLQHECRQLMRQGEDDMEVGHGLRSQRSRLPWW